MVTAQERSLWALVYDIRNRYKGKVDNDEQFKAVMDESGELYDKYKDTDAAVPARWCCMMLREMFNNEWMIAHGKREAME